MRRILLATVLILATFSFVSCYWFSSLGKGDVSFTFSEEIAKGDYDFYGRVYLLANGNRFALTGTTEYIQVPLSDMESTTVVVDGIPVGPEYTALISVVQQRPGGWFSTEGWGKSVNPFHVVPGETISIPMTFQNSPDFYPASDLLMEKSLKDVEDIGGIIYAADSEKLYTDVFSYPPTEIPIEPTYTINSLSEGLDYTSQYGDPQLWINSNKGILPYVIPAVSAPYFDTNFSTALGPVSVLDSSARRTSVLYQHMAFFRTANGLGGVLIPPSTPPDSWNWINTIHSGITDLFVAYGYSLYQGDAYYAASGGAFRLASDFLTDPDLNKHRTLFSAPSPIISLGLQDISGDGDMIFMGTENGAWSAGPTYDASVISTPKIESGIENFKIYKTAVSEYPYHRAYLSTNYLFIVTVNPAIPSETLSVYPFVSGLPGRITGMTWQYVSGNAYYLFISGEEGLVYRYVLP